MAVVEESLGQCFHGGASFEAIGFRFEHLDRVTEVINADVLDAWFPPAPGVTSTLQEHLEWVVKTSPPTGCDGLLTEIGLHRRVPENSVLPGAGSSSLIFTALLHYLSSTSRVLILDPTYGEYRHLLENVIKCRVDHFPLNVQDEFETDLTQLEDTIRIGYDLVVLVNPNNPTGRYIPRPELEALLANCPQETLVWIDETYIEYVGPEESLEGFAANSANVVVCKSMSKTYALSGLRVGYLCGPPRIIDAWRQLNPPWAVSLPGQLGAIAALRDPQYYGQKYLETHTLRKQLAYDLTNKVGFAVIPGCANYLYCQIPESRPTAKVLLTKCHQRDLFLRDPSANSPNLGQRSLRIAVKDWDTNQLMVEILRETLLE